jgi:3-hydroxybutyryl-CoA dehydrogenase
MQGDAIQRVAIIGAGLMGHGIAQEYALAGYAVCIHDVSDEKLAQATARMGDNLRMLAGLGLATPEQAETVPERIRTATDLGEAVSDADLVVEAVFEDLALKQRIFADLDRLCAPGAILASNSSSFMPSTLAAATARPDKVLVTHYFNPPHLLPLVEVVRSAETSDETVDAVCAALRKVGKHPAVVRKEAPGFVGNRLQMALFREALSIVAQGIASPQDVDTVVRYGFGRRLAAAGPFEVFELASLDLVLAVAEQLFPEIESSPEVPAILKDKVARGELGVKSLKGFYVYTPESAEALRRRVAQALIRIAQWE